MAAGAPVGRTLEQTPTWAVGVVCFVLVVVSFLIEHIIHLIGQWLKKKHKRALCEALEKFKSELMLLGFISLLLTVGQGPITSICISEQAAATWHPCDRKQQSAPDKTAGSGTEITNRRRLLSLQDSGVGFRRVLAAASTGDKCAAKGMVPFVSVEGIHQLHIFIFLLAVFHVLNCLLTIVFGRAKMRRWKTWENETKTAEYQFSNDSKRFRFTRETSFGRRHLSFWTKTPVLMWIVCFFRQFVRSVPKVDYLTLRHGFIMTHLAPQSQAQYNFQKYIKRSLEEDFKVVVGISPPIWFFAVLFLLFNTHGWYSYRWLPFIPLIIIFLVGAKLQAIITKMALRINDRGEVVKGAPVVQPGDHLFWFNRPCILLFLINFVLFQNAFQLAFVAWSWYEFGLKSCFHDSTEEVVIRISMGIVVQILCSYVTLPLYALVTQMGSTMKPTIFNERIAKALRDWHQSAKKHIKQRGEGSVNSTSSRPSIPSHRTMSPLQLLQHYKSDVDCRSTSPRKSSSFDLEQQCWEIESQSPSTRPRQDDEGSVSSQHHHGNEAEEDVSQEPSFRIMAALAESGCTQHTIDIGAKEFAFGESSDRI